MAIKEAQINLRLPADLDAWVEARAGGKREKPAFVREVLARERAHEEEGKMLEMFNRAWDSLSPEEQEEVRDDREDWMSATGGFALVSGLIALRGEIWEINLNPRKGREQKGLRPCLIVSTDGMNRSRFGTVIVCSVTTTERERFIWRPLIVPEDLRVTDAAWTVRPHWVETDQIITVDTDQRLVRRLAVIVNAEKMKEVDTWLQRLLIPSSQSLG